MISERFRENLKLESGKLRLRGFPSCLGSVILGWWSTVRINVNDGQVQGRQLEQPETFGLTFGVTFDLTCFHHSTWP